MRRKDLPFTIAIHQPEFMPWLGFFQKMELCDLYVVFDNVQFKKRYFENRNRIAGGKWLTVPVKSRGRYLQNINNVEIDTTLPWKRKFFGTLRHAYAKYSDFKRIEENLVNCIMPIHFTRLIDLNLTLIRFLREHFFIKTSLVYSSQLGLPSVHGSDLILQICRELNAEAYICGPSGVNYLNFSSFKKNGIQIIPQNFFLPKTVGIPKGPESFFSSLHHIICLGIQRSKTLIKEICS